MFEARQIFKIKTVEHGIFREETRVPNFNQSEARKYCLLSLRMQIIRHFAKHDNHLLC